MERKENMMSRTKENLQILSAIQENAENGEAVPHSELMVCLLADISKSLAIIADAIGASQVRGEEKEGWFYFTFSADDPSQPFYEDDFVAVWAKDIKEAARKFMKEYPCMENGESVNCEDYYSAEDFAKIWRERFLGKEPVEEIR